MIVKYHSMLSDSRQNLRCKPFPWHSHIGLKSIYPSSPPFMEGFFLPCVQRFGLDGGDGEGEGIVAEGEGCLDGAEDDAGGEGFAAEGDFVHGFDSGSMLRSSNSPFFMPESNAAPPAPRQADFLQF